MSNLIRAYLTPRKEARLLSQTVNAQEKNAEEPSSKYHIYKQLVRLTKHDISYQEISQHPQKHELAHKIIMHLYKGMKSQYELSQANYAAKSMNSHKQIPLGLKSMTSHKQIS